jgi:hypothetical protein
VAGRSHGAAAPRRLTRSSAGESAAAFARDGSLLFTSARPDPDAKADPDKKIAALWRCRPKAARPSPARARRRDRRRRRRPKRRRDRLRRLVHPAATSLEDDAARAKARTDAKVGALLFEDYPIRFWDHWLAPRRQRFFAAPLPADPEAGSNRPT